MTAALLAALIAVESGGDARAVGDDGRSIGVLQITKACVQDVNRIYGTRYKWPKDCFDVNRSRVICNLYMVHYAGWNASDERMARIWVGGPKGHRRASTLPYWRKVREALLSKSKTK